MTADTTQAMPYGWAIVTRTNGSSAEPPCEGATRITGLDTIEHRWAYRPEERDEAWLAVGSNHHVEGEYRVRTVKEGFWFIHIPDAEALADFCRRYGKVIVMAAQQEHDTLAPYMALEIYDGWRE